MKFELRSSFHYFRDLFIFYPIFALLLILTFHKIKIETQKSIQKYFVCELPLEGLRHCIFMSESFNFWQMKLKLVQSLCIRFIVGVRCPAKKTERKSWPFRNGRVPGYRARPRISCVVFESTARIEQAGCSIVDPTFAMSNISFHVKSHKLKMNLITKPMVAAAKNEN